MIKPGLFSEVNLGVAAFGSISGTLTAATAGGGYEGIWGVRVLLRDENGTTVGNSVTSRDGYYYLGEVRPGKYTVVIDEETLPPGYQMDVVTRDVEVLSGTEPFEVDDLSFLGEYLGPPPEETHEIEDGNIKYKVFE
jgi:hypothetical protein